VELYLHPQYLFMGWYLVKYWGNFTLRKEELCDMYRSVNTVGAGIAQSV
jgi:hypothetical protein